jgi:hypothetical protein
VTITVRDATGAQLTYRDTAFKDGERCGAELALNARDELVLVAGECGTLLQVDHGWLFRWKSVSLRMDVTGRLQVSAGADYTLSYSDDGYTTATAVTGVLVRSEPPAR